MLCRQCVSTDFNMSAAHHGDGVGASKFSQQLRDRTCHKTYLARVRGRFPDTMEVKQPIMCIDRALGVHCVREDGEWMCGECVGT